MIWRDDDVLMSPHTIGQLLRVDDMLQAAGKRHTVAIIAETLTPELGAIIRERDMDAQLHCWTHDDLSVDQGAVAQLPMAIAKIEDLVGTRPTVLYPPWNRTSSMLDAAAAKLGLEVSTEKLSLGQYLRGARGLPINFHFWHEPDVELLKRALA
jgi:peptidoglycan/xylan/chitin deacetylase (PgdA/CDA1 family)